VHSTNRPRQILGIYGYVADGSSRELNQAVSFLTANLLVIVPRRTRAFFFLLIVLRASPIQADALRGSSAIVLFGHGDRWTVSDVQVLKS
jgi:hypothetical protein